MSNQKRKASYGTEHRIGGALMSIKTFKVYTKWTGYSEYIVNAKNEQEAKDSIEEELKFDGFAEEILKVKEVS